MEFKENQQNRKVIYRFGYYSSIFTAFITLVTFGVAMTAIPISGAFCPEGCIEYPYLDTFKQFPKDFIWMYFAIILAISYLIFMVAIHYCSDLEKKMYSHIGLLFALISSSILIVNYFVQATVIPASLASGETLGLPILIQYNSHGLFIALEDISYLLMSFSFLFISMIFTDKNRIKMVIRWVYRISFLIVIVSFIGISYKYGLDRKDRFEVVVISINWLVLIVNGILVGIVFKNKLKQISHVNN